MEDLEIDGVIGMFWVPRVNDCGERFIEMCSELGILIENVYFKKRLIHMYTWERVVHGGVSDRNGYFG